MRETVFCIVTRFGRLDEIANTVHALFYEPLPKKAYLFLDEGIPIVLRAIIVREFKKRKPKTTESVTVITSYAQLRLLIGFYQWIRPEYKRARERKLRDKGYR